MRLRDVKAVFFDLYGTLARFWPPREALQSRACREFGFSVTTEGITRGYESADTFMAEENASHPLRQRSPQETQAFFSEYERRILQGAGVNIDLRQAAKIWQEVRRLPYHMALFDDVLPSLSRLKGLGLILGLISNMNRKGDELCQSLGLSTILDFAVTSGEVKAEKPHPSIFLVALERASVEPSQAVHVGDQYSSDIAGAQGVGIQPVMMDRYRQRPESLDYPLVHSMPELEQFLVS